MARIRSILTQVNSENPSQAVLDCAVELAKRYGTNNSAQFVNGHGAFIAGDHDQIDQAID